MDETYFNQFLAVMKRRAALRPWIGGIAFKHQGQVYAFGDVPERNKTIEPIPDALRVVEDRPGRDDIIPVVRIDNPRFWQRGMTQRNLGLGEAFIAGEFTMEQGSVWHMVAFFIRNEIDKSVGVSWAEKLELLAMYVKWRWSHNHNEDIADHYDMGDDIMTPMLGRTGAYSCGYVIGDADTLDEMQVNKMNLIFSKLRLKPGERVLDTGCGNGGCLIHAAQGYGVTGEGFSNSYNMVRLARENVQRNGLQSQLQIKLDDFQSLRGYPSESFDAIYETGVWEHLPYEDYPFVMAQCYRILKPGGRILIHSMGDYRNRHVRDEYIQKYIFRDSNQIILSKLLVEAEKLGFYVGDVENLGRHYYHTLWWWDRNLGAAAAEIPDKKKLRIQQYFLQCGMAESRFGDGALYHLLLYKNPRNYLDLWRITKDNMTRRPLQMKSNADNRVTLMSPDADPQKWKQQVYKRPGLRTRVDRLWNLVTSFYH
jgi:cyclopropane-fatty-acyl-phospholipid synthase